MDTLVKPSQDKLSTNIYYKPTDSHSFLRYDSSHPKACKDSIPYSQFLRLRRICSEDEDFETNSNQLKQHFQVRGYPSNVIDEAHAKTQELQRATTLLNQREKQTDERIPLVLTYHPTNLKIKDKSSSLKTLTSLQKTRKHARFSNNHL